MTFFAFLVFAAASLPIVLFALLPTVLLARLARSAEDALAPGLAQAGLRNT